MTVAECGAGPRGRAAGSVPTGRASAARRFPYRAAAAGTALAVVAVLATLLGVLVRPAAAQAPPQSAGASLPLPAEQSPAAEAKETAPSPTGVPFKPPHGWKRSTIVVFGDSLTEMGTSTPGGWVTGLAAMYSRRADILNRGFGGYTSKQAVQIVPEVADSISHKRTALAVVWWGANDAVNPQGPQAFMHVSLEDYATNLKTIVAKFKAAGVQNVMLVTPPPVDDAKRAAATPGFPPDRLISITEKYADAAVAAGAEAGVPVLNVFREIQSAFPDRAWSEKLMQADGLHFNEEGNKWIANLMNNFIWSNVPAARTEALPYHHPSWEEVQYGASAAQFEAERLAANSS
ncbi:isoamyl acetate-hydrolyzing esterase [Raphidocelis subcapitata]|uniref:Isoamyl acetate-hydrolyzing esterase n=1 Tax=Raphidocelis subcapitata TaxID=307507 RepID=A0A2V0P663_9CHLO|nr:isoamyl acetate-hydrolyzing esterase [Raphidocelis subcapitata]|eukprot:GBF95364.1 isoamyl acetate-hydrolyzing esterase [Raphidocelis subcapitata]